MQRPDLDAEQILQALAARQVDYILIGGYAALLQGSPFPTDDIDITPNPDRANLDRLSDALRDLGATIYASEEEEEPLPFSHTGASLADGSVWSLATRHGILDLSMRPTGTDGYHDLARDADLKTVYGGLVVKVAALADIIRSKQAANRLKDQRVLPLLREMLARRPQEQRPS